MKTSRIIFTTGAVHFALSIVFDFLDFGRAMRGLDTGRAPTQLELAVTMVHDVLRLPFDALLSRHLPNNASGFVQLLPLIMNSLFWGICLCLLIRLLPLNRSQQAQSVSAVESRGV